MSGLQIICVAHRPAWPAAEALRRDLASHEPDATVTLVAAEEGEAVAGEAFGPLASMFAAPELAQALVPFALATSLSKHDAPAVFLSPDAVVTGALDPVRCAVESSAPVVLIPRRLTPAAVSADEPVCDDGFAALAGEGGQRLAAWWCEQVLLEGPGVAWLDHLMTLAEDVVLLRDPGCGVAPWNLDERPLRSDNGKLVAGGAPLRWVRLPGLHAGGPLAIDGMRLSGEPVLRELAEIRLTAMVAPTRQVGDPLTHAVSGLRLDARIRALYARGHRAGKLPHGVFHPSGAAAFLTWLRDPDPDPAAGGVSRYLFHIHSSRDDLRAVYPDLRRAEDRDGFLGWVHAYGVEQYTIPEELLPAAPTPARAEPGRGPSPARVTRPWGVNVAGYFQSELGVGEAARRIIDALDAAQVPLLPVQGSIVPASRRGQEFASAAAQTAPFAINVVCVNADGLPDFARDVGPEFFADRWTIGLWWWEVAAFPERYTTAFEHVDEVWVGSQHVLDAIAPVSPVPVVKVRLPVRVAPVTWLSRAQLGLPEGFLFLFLFDYQSVFTRKNPLGLIDAFARAFPEGSGASLAIKCINSHLHQAAHEELLLAATRHSDVHIVDRYVTAGERDAMLAACDCYVSLHRSEGFGLTLAEAMYLGKPVVATGYSGNLEYMTADTGWLVPYELVPIGPGADPYPADGLWADPDLSAAAIAMREVFDDPEEAARRGLLAAKAIRETQSPRVAGEVLRHRLEVLQPWVADRQRVADVRAQEEAENAIAATRERIATGPDDYAARRAGALGRLARRVLLRTARPVTANQHAVDEQIADAIERLTLASARQSEQTRLDALVLYAAALARLRRLDERQAEQGTQLAATQAGLRRLDERQAEQGTQLAATQAATTPIVDAAEALPYTAGDPFLLFDHPIAGRVLGFREPTTATEHGTEYARFEAVFRGSRRRVAELVEPYVDLLRGHAPVLDVGCGRGELLDALCRAGVEARGVDRDEGMAQEARVAGLDVEVGDGLAALEALADSSLGAVTSIQVIEHLPEQVLRRFFYLAAAKLRPGGLFVAETVNPHAAPALKTFWVDLTHQHPVFPEVALALAAQAGFRSAFVCHLRGTRDVERDRFAQDSYAVVAEAPEASWATERL